MTEQFIHFIMSLLHSRMHLDLHDFEFLHFVALQWIDRVESGQTSENCARSFDCNIS